MNSCAASLSAKRRPDTSRDGSQSNRVSEMTAFLSDWRVRKARLTTRRRARAESYFRGSRFIAWGSSRVLTREDNRDQTVDSEFAMVCSDRPDAVSTSPTDARDSGVTCGRGLGKGQVRERNLRVRWGDSLTRALFPRGRTPGRCSMVERPRIGRSKKCSCRTGWTGCARAGCDFQTATALLFASGFRLASNL